MSVIVPPGYPPPPPLRIKALLTIWLLIFKIAYLVCLFFTVDFLNLAKEEATRLTLKVAI
jgi:hypothetical protein